MSNYVSTYMNLDGDTCELEASTLGEVFVYTVDVALTLIVLIFAL